MTTPIFDSIIAGRIEDIKNIRGYLLKEHAPHITCADGTTLSVQASSNHYCTPRTHRGPYSKVEVGYPSVAPPDSWADYFDGEWGRDAPTDSVYACVPIELVREFSLAHGGEQEES